MNLSTKGHLKDGPFFLTATHELARKDKATRTNPRCLGIGVISVLFFLHADDADFQTRIIGEGRSL